MSVHSYHTKYKCHLWFAVHHLLILLFALFSSLKESLIPYLDAKDSELATDLQDTFPDEILLSHAAATWKAAAVFKRERRES